MKIEPKGTPSTQQTSQPSGVERAIAKMNAGLNQAQSAPVSNPSQVSPEEISALNQQNGQTSHNDDSKQVVSEETPSTPVEQKSSEPPLSSQYAILARKEKAHRAQVAAERNALKAKEAELAAREEAIKSKDVDYQQNYIPKSRLTEDTITTLLEAGITYDQITQMALNQGQSQQDPATKLAIQKLEAKVRAQEEAQERQAKSYQEEQSRQYQQAINQIRNEVNTLVRSDPEFETIHATNSTSDVVDLIERTFKEDGTLLSVQEAAQEVENYLMEEALKISQIKKIQRKLQPSAQTATQKQQVQPQKQQQSQLKTLTNAVGVSRPLTAKERAILAFKGELKN